MTSPQYVDFLEGNGWRYQFNDTTGLYKKEALNERSIIKHELLEDILDPSDIIVGTHFVSQYDLQSTHYGYGVEKVNLPDIPFHIGHQSSDQICITRNSSNEKGLIRIYDKVFLNGSLLELGDHLNLEAKLILHFPGQLIDKIETPLHSTTLKEMHYKRASDQMFWEGKIVQVSVLKNRPYQVFSG